VEVPNFMLKDLNHTPKALEFYMPAEWEKQEAIWLTWPKNPVTWPKKVAEVQDVYLRLIEIIGSYQTINLLVDSEQEENRVRGLLAKDKISDANLFFFHIPTKDAWIRDYGPTFVVKKNNLGMVHWIFNAWGNKYEILKEDGLIPKKINETLQVKYFTPKIILEGGSIDVDGEGTVLVTEQCLLNKNRNPTFSREKIEETLSQFLNIEKILWLKEGIEGDDTDGHIDDISRFVAPSVVVTSIEKDEMDSNYLPLMENFKRLSTMTDAKNRPLSIVELPMPKKIFTNKNKPLPASYANFLITNEVVLVPIFQQKNDEKALIILKELFPSREVIGIPCNDLILGGGTIHCLSQQQPLVLKSR
jgi:agmatine deiminase